MNRDCLLAPWNSLLQYFFTLMNLRQVEYSQYDSVSEKIFEAISLQTHRLNYPSRHWTLFQNWEITKFASARSNLQSRVLRPIWFDYSRPDSTKSSQNRYHQKLWMLLGFHLVLFNLKRRKIFKNFLNFSIIRLVSNQNLDSIVNSVSLKV